MKCPRCEQDNPPAAAFCNACGGRLAQLCLGCAHPNAAGSRFCTACGQSLVPASESARVSRDALDGERKQITILFADLKSSLEMVADRDPEEARRLLDPILERMIDAVHRYEGTVNQVMGDGIMALFGAPLAQEDHAVRACYAALRMQESMRVYAAEQRRVAGVSPQVRIGVNSGEVVVRSIDSGRHIDYSAIGQSTHVAARMEQLARPGAILVAGATARLAEDYFTFTALAPLAVKGLPEPVEVHELTGAREVRSRVHAAAARGLTRFVGRDAEMMELARAHAQAASGMGQMVAIVGDPGVGKSRLVWEFLRSPLMRDWQVLEAGCVPFGRTMAYLPIVALLRSYFGLSDRDLPATVAARVRTVLTPEELPRFVSPLVALLGASPDDPRWESLDPDQRRRRTLEAVTHALTRGSHERPLCLVVEDLHWADAETQATLDRLAEGLPTSRLLLVVTYRPEYQHGWGGRTYYAQIRIDPLAGASAAALLEELIGCDASLAALTPVLIERAGGNPFFLEESVRNLAESGALRGRRGAYATAGASTAPEIPDTVRAVLAARIDRLAPDDKRVLQSAAVIGRDVPLALLEAVAEVPAHALEQSLARLRAAEFLYEVRLFPEPEHTFKHALTQDVALAGLLRERRRALDARIVDALERLHPDEMDRLAHHALRGEVWDKALAYSRAAGTRAAAHSAHRMAARSFEHALEALQHLPDTRQRREHAVDIRLDLRYSLSPLGEYGRMLEYLHEAERLATDLGDELRLGRVCSFLTNFHTVMLDFPLAIDYGRKAMDIAERHREISLQAVAATFLALAHLNVGELPRAVELAHRNIAVLEGDRERERYGMAILPAVYARVILAWALAEAGDFDDAAAAAAAAVRIADGAEHAYSIIFGCWGLGLVHSRRGDFEHAVPVLERGRALSEKADVPVNVGLTAGALASAYAHGGRAEDAIVLLDDAIERAVAMGDLYGHWLRTGGLAEAYLLGGRAKEALPLAERAVDLTRYVKARPQEAWALHLQGTVAAGQTLPLAAEAQRAFTESLALAEQLGMHPLAARCRLGLGDLRLRVGDTDGRDELARAREAFRAMRMTFWMRRSEALLST